MLQRLAAGAEARLALTAGLTLLAMASVGCDGDDGRTVIVELRTDYVPGFEFTEVAVELDGAIVERAGAPEGDLVEGLVIAELDGVPTGTRRFRVSLLDDAGFEIAARRYTVEVTGPLAVVVNIARLCTARCPGPGDDVSATECFGNRCVTPACRPDDLAACGEPECQRGDDCMTSSVCAMAVCGDGECLLGWDNGRCPAGERCDPAVGCIPIPDASVPDSSAPDTGPVDTGPMDTGPMDTGVADTGVADTGTVDTGTLDAPETCVPTPEICDGTDDDDCDGTVDEGCACTNGTTRACTGLDVGICSAGRETCVTGAWDGACVGVIGPESFEECGNGTDDDCDGRGDSADECCFTGTFGGHTYLFCRQDRGSRDRSASRCSTWGPGYNLAEINDSSENAYVASMLPFGVSYWIGLTETMPDVYRWDGGGTSTFRNWGAGEPDLPPVDGTVIRGVVGTWQDRIRSESNDYVCESP